MKYGELPTFELGIKLMECSFESPQKNLEVYKFVKSIRGYQEFFENERTKLLQKYGKSNGDGTYNLEPEELKKYNDELMEILEMEIDGEIYPPNLTEENFTDLNCRYSDDKNFWLSPTEIAKIIDFSEKINKEKEKK